MFAIEISGRRRTPDHGRSDGLRRPTRLCSVSLWCSGSPHAVRRPGAQAMSPTSSVRRPAPRLRPLARRFVQHWRAWGRQIQLPADPPALRAYAIYPYLIAARLQAALSERPSRRPTPQLDASVATFLQEQRGERSRARSRMTGS